MKQLNEKEAPLDFKTIKLSDVDAFDFKNSYFKEPTSHDMEIVRNNRRAIKKILPYSSLYTMFWIVLFISLFFIFSIGILMYLISIFTGEGSVVILLLLLVFYISAGIATYYSVESGFLDNSERVVWKRIVGGSFKVMPAIPIGYMKHYEVGSMSADMSMSSDAYYYMYCQVNDGTYMFHKTCCCSKNFKKANKIILIQLNNIMTQKHKEPKNSIIALAYKEGDDE